jgi:hypothetical protein
VRPACGNAANAVLVGNRNVLADVLRGSSGVSDALRGSIAVATSRTGCVAVSGMDTASGTEGVGRVAGAGDATRGGGTRRWVVARARRGA